MKGTKLTPLTPDQIEFAKRSRNVGRTWRAIGRSLGCDWEFVKRAVHPEFAEHRKSQIREARAKRDGHRSSSNPMYASRRVDIPDTVLKEREACFVKVSITAAFFGDPPPGRSALDKQRENLAEKSRIEFGFKVGLSQ